MTARTTRPAPERTTRTRGPRHWALAGTALLTLGTVCGVAGGGSAVASTDGRPPTAQVTLSRPHDFGAWYDHEASVSVTITPGDAPLDLDASRIVVLDHDLQPTGLDEPRTSLSLDVTQEGVTNVEWSVEDADGNRAVGAVQIYIDSIDPVVTTTGLPDEGTTLPQGSVVPVSLDCQDGGDFYYASGLLPGGCQWSAGVTNGQVDTSTPGPITVTGQAQDQAGNLTTVTRHYTVTAAPGRPRPQTPPAILGYPMVGNSLFADPGHWTGATPTFTYQWLRDGAVIPGATDASYTPVDTDLRRKLKVRVTATNDAGRRTALSRPVKVRVSELNP